MGNPARELAGSKTPRNRQATGKGRATRNGAANRGRGPGDSELGGIGIVTQGHSSSDGPEVRQRHGDSNQENLAASSVETWPDRLIEVKRMRAGDILPHERNPRRHPKQQLEPLKGLLNEVGKADVLRAYYSERNGGKLTFWDGHARRDLDNNQEWSVAIFDITDSEADKLLLSFDPLASLAAYDKDALDALLKEVSTGDEALTQMLAGLAKDNGLSYGQEPAPAPEPQIDKAAELQVKWNTRLGQLWQIGKHRLLCGDSTAPRDVERVLAGAKPHLMVTDPPYGVNYEGGEVNEKKREKLRGDEDAGLYVPAFALSPSNVAYTWFAGTQAHDVYGAAIAQRFEPRALIIWNKLKAHYGAPSAHYKQRSEPCLYAVRKGNSAKWIGDMTEPTVWDIEQPHVHEHHLTQKPLECMARPIRNHEGDVYDPFVGVGTTIVAAQQLNRTCYAIDIDPKWVAVTLQRTADMGLEPKLIEAEVYA